MRKHLSTEEDLVHWLVELAEGIIGSASVLADLWEASDEAGGLNLFFRLTDMNIRGPQIWVGYKDHCKENLAMFIECLYSRDADMIATINKECPHDGYGNPATAVISGGNPTQKG